MVKWFCILGVLAIMAAPGSAPAATRIKCASTTSTQNSGLFDYLLPKFEKKSGIKVDVVAVGTGAAIEIGKRGDADVVLVHAKNQELKAVEEGFFVDRHDVMYNDFVIIGPPNDPAKIKGLKSATEAFKKIAESQVPLCLPGGQIRHPHQGAGHLETGGDRPQGAEMVYGSGPGHGEDPAGRQRKAGLYPH